MAWGEPSDLYTKALLTYSFEAERARIGLGQVWVVDQAPRQVRGQKRQAYIFEGDFQNIHKVEAEGVIVPTLAVGPGEVAATD